MSAERSNYLNYPRVPRDLPPDLIPFAKVGLLGLEASVGRMPFTTKGPNGDEVNFLVLSKHGYRTITIDSKRNEIVEEVASAIGNIIESSWITKVGIRLFGGRGILCDGVDEGLVLNSKLIITTRGMLIKDEIDESCKLKSIDEKKAKEFLQLILDACSSFSQR